MTLRSAMLGSVFLLASVMPGFAQESSDQQTTHSHSQWHHRSDIDSLMRGDRLPRMLAALSNGTFFRLKHGDDEITVYCPHDANLQDCTSAAVDLSKAVPNMGSESSTDEQNEQNNDNQQNNQK